MSAFALLLLVRWSRRTGGRIALVVPVALPLALVGTLELMGSMESVDPLAGAAFIAAIARHRHFERETDPPRV